MLSTTRAAPLGVQVVHPDERAHRVARRGWWTWGASRQAGIRCSTRTGTDVRMAVDVEIVRRAAVGGRRGARGRVALGKRRFGAKRGGTDVRMAVDMEITRRPAMFLGNIHGWSSFTRNVVRRGWCGSFRGSFWHANAGVESLRLSGDDIGYVGTAQGVFLKCRIDAGWLERRFARRLEIAVASALI
ncbi:hypothetical protein B0H17DRAFT_1136505 [Mycena rosella]|uniref:Uncharacterized protein n=1 Tax=Mycena rosella TaxID=1033263 RepID=A0AAD7GFX1_MYCRO|nr:hypothetical protein B0H17DRAFT_1136505 [Mycena rosella]